jgi:hypothetical protein
VLARGAGFGIGLQQVGWGPDGNEGGAEVSATCNINPDDLALLTGDDAASPTMAPSFTVTPSMVPVQQTPTAGPAPAPVPAPVTQAPAPSPVAQVPEVPAPVPAASPVPEEAMMEEVVGEESPGEELVGGGIAAFDGFRKQW